MLALRSHAVLARARPSSVPARSVLRYPLQRRFFWGEFYNGLTPAANEFLDLATALPFPPSFPPYTSTILLGTVLLRLAFLPTVLWVCMFFVIEDRLLTSCRVVARL
jgi:inner membrane protein COX18